MYTLESLASTANS